MSQPPQAAEMSGALQLDVNRVLVAAPKRRLQALALDYVLLIVMFVFPYLYWLWKTSAHGQTPGKKILRLVVVSTDTGLPLTRSPLLLREGLITGIALLGIPTVGIIDYLAAASLFLPTRQPAWDRI